MKNLIIISLLLTISTVCRAEDIRPLPIIKSDHNVLIMENVEDILIKAKASDSNGTKILEKINSLNGVINNQQQLIESLQTKINDFGNFEIFRCNNILYNCTPKECLQHCLSQHKRMVTIDDLLKWAAKGQDYCNGMWALTGLNDLISGFPMFRNRTTSGCGEINTGDVPRIIGIGVNFDWEGRQKLSNGDVTTTRNKSDCACIAR
ncbi:MAG: hypothetical protein HQK50_05640 [Oligoflexia bacterium]|nr:hypothetical protein [Oligoflexia bacterium]MBF0365032.1 hypothetical protein [Oligoflexia bacterium]